MKLLAIIAAVWFVLSILTAIVWALVMSSQDRRHRESQVITEAEAILDAEFQRMWEF
jgi:hypothetical protein